MITSVAEADMVRLTSYMTTDPLMVPKALSDVLHYFDGRSTRSALEAISAEGLDVDRAAVRRLVDFEVLIEEDSGDAGPSK